MNNVSLVTVNWNQLNCVKLLLKSYVKYHYKGEPLKLVLVDNFSQDGSREWLEENEIPHYPLASNRGHENALNTVWNEIDSDIVIINDTDIEYTGNIGMYISLLQSQKVDSIGEIVENYFEQIKLKDRISPWFLMLNLKKIKAAGIQYFRDPAVEDWTYDVGSWLYEQMREKGLRNFNIPRKKGNQDLDLVSMTYNYAKHWGKVSWDIVEHLDRFDEINKRRNAIELQLLEYDDIDVRGKFISGLKK